MGIMNVDDSGKPRVILCFIMRIAISLPVIRSFSDLLVNGVHFAVMRIAFVVFIRRSSERPEITCMG
jgi:membrane protein implicated in regulation of membrane protease activity